MKVQKELASELNSQYNKDRYIRDPTNRGLPPRHQEGGYDYTSHLTRGPNTTAYQDYEEIYEDPEIIRGENNEDDIAITRVGDEGPHYENHSASVMEKQREYVNTSDIHRQIELDQPIYFNIHIDHAEKVEIPSTKATNGEESLTDEGIYANSEITVRHLVEKLISPEFSRFIKYGIRPLLKGELLDTIVQNLSGNGDNLIQDFICDICCDDEDFEMIRVIQSALLELGKCQEADKITWEVQKERLRQKAEHIADILPIREIYGEMHSQGVISSRQKEELLAQKTNRDMSLYCINEVVLRLSSIEFNKFIEILKDKNRGDIAQMIEYIKEVPDTDKNI